MPCTKLSPSYSKLFPSSDSFKFFSSWMFLNLAKYFFPSSSTYLQRLFSYLNLSGFCLFAYILGQRAERMFMQTMGLKQESCSFFWISLISIQNYLQLHSRPQDSICWRLSLTLGSFSSIWRKTMMGSKEVRPTRRQVRQSILLRYFPYISPLLSRCLFTKSYNYVQSFRSFFLLQTNSSIFNSFPKTITHIFSYPIRRYRLMQRMQQFIEFFSTWSVLDLGGIRQIPSLRLDVLIWRTMPSKILTAKVVRCASSALLMVSMKDWAKVSRSLRDDFAPPKLAIIVGIYTDIAWGDANFMRVQKYYSAVKAARLAAFGAGIGGLGATEGTCAGKGLGGTTWGGWGWERLNKGFFYASFGTSFGTVEGTSTFCLGIEINKLYSFVFTVVAGYLLGFYIFIALLENMEGVDGWAALAKDKLIVGAVAERLNTGPVAWEIVVCVLGRSFPSFSSFSSTSFWMVVFLSPGRRLLSEGCSLICAAFLLSSKITFLALTLSSFSLASCCNLLSLICSLSTICLLRSSFSLFSSSDSQTREVLVLLRYFSLISSLILLPYFFALGGELATFVWSGDDPCGSVILPYYYFL